MENIEQNGYETNYNQQNDNLQPKTVFGGLGLGFGIASIVIFWIPVIGLILGILGIIFTILAKRVVGLRIAGAICSGIGTLLSLAITSLFIIGFIALSRSGNLLEQELMNMNTPSIITQDSNQHELVGIWTFYGTDWYSFRADGTAVNLIDGEEFFWNENGTLDSIVYTNWEINNGVLTIHWNIGISFEYQRR